MADPVLEAPPQERERTETAAPRTKTGWPLWAWTSLIALGIAAIVAGVVGVKLVGNARDDPYSAPSTGVGAVLLPGANRAPALAAGAPAPDFSLPTLTGGPASLAQYRGQAVLVNFWATWCPPCRAEMPDIQQVYQEQRQQGFVVLAVNIQEAGEPIAQFINRYGLTFPILMDVNGDVVQRYGIYALPSSYFIDREGRIAEVYTGPLAKPAITKKVEGLLH